MTVLFRSGWFAAVLSFCCMPVDFVLGQVADSDLRSTGSVPAQRQVEEILVRIRSHSFHPVRDGFTFDRLLNKHGIADLKAPDWRVRLLAVRDLVRTGTAGIPDMEAALKDVQPHVRQVAAMALGVLGAERSAPALASLLKEDSEPLVRSQAAVSLRQIGSSRFLKELETAQKEDASKDVRHQAELSIHAIRNGRKATAELKDAFATLDEVNFDQIRVGRSAPDFELTDTEGRAWRLSQHRGTKSVVLIWIFADWCPVCHGEFRELIDLRRQFEEAGIHVATLECHDTYEARVMVGKELDPKYWFSKQSFKESYTQKIWWPHLADRAGVVAAQYGVQPMAFAVHSEWINRPSVVIVDKEGVVRFAYYGTFWGDRPAIHDILKMIRTGQYAYENPGRLSPGKGSGTQKAGS